VVVRRGLVCAEPGGVLVRVGGRASTLPESSSSESQAPPWGSRGTGRPTPRGRPFDDGDHRFGLRRDKANVAGRATADAETLATSVDQFKVMVANAMDLSGT